MYRIIVFVLLGLCAGATKGHFSCSEISGTWQNQLGSNMTLIRLGENQLTGEYSTAVHRESYTSLIASNITGSVTHLHNGALFAFTVLFNNGRSLATWVGQCMVCNGEETLFTTWMLRAHHGKVRDRWIANNINQDTFKRMRKEHTNSIPLHLRRMGPTVKAERDQSCEKTLEAGKNGIWASESEAVHFANCYEGGVLIGKHRDQPLHGRQHTKGSYTALGLVSSTAEGAKGWTGYIYDSTKEKERKVLSTWLKHAYSEDCKNPRSLVQFGMDKYTYGVTYQDSVKEKLPQEEETVTEPESKGFLGYISSAIHTSLNTVSSLFSSEKS